MKLLFKREQATSKFGRALFKLWSKVEIDELEAEAVKKYSFDNKILIEVEQTTLIRNSALMGFLALVVVYAILWILGLTSALIAVLAGVAAGYFYYHQKRETIFVRDLMYGRYFTCRSVIELAQKEAELDRIVTILRQVMETAKHWDGTESVDIPVLDKDAAKQLVIQLR